MLALFHFKAHSHRLKVCHPLVYTFCRKTESEAYGKAGDGVFHRRLVDKRQRVGLAFTFIIYIGDFRFASALVYTTDIQGGVGVFLRPRHMPARVVSGSHAAGYRRVVGRIYYHVGVVEELQLLLHLFVERVEVLLMGRTDIGYHAHRGLDDVAQGRHLARLADSRLEDAHLGLLTEEPYGEGHSYLGIVAARAARYGHRGR